MDGDFIIKSGKVGKSHQYYGAESFKGKDADFVFVLTAKMDKHGDSVVSSHSPKQCETEKKGDNTVHTCKCKIRPSKNKNDCDTVFYTPG